MQAIEFESQLSHGAIPVPEFLHLVDGRRVRVLLLLEKIEDRTVESYDAIADRKSVGTARIIKTVSICLPKKPGLRS